MSHHMKNVSSREGIGHEKLDKKKCYRTEKIKIKYEDEKFENKISLREV